MKIQRQNLKLVIAAAVATMMLAACAPMSALGQCAQQADPTSG